MNDNRGMSPSQAKALASDPKTSAGVLARLANGYPEAWPELLANPSVSPELISWIQNAMSESSVPVAEVSKQVSSSTPKPKLKAAKSRGRRRYGRFARTIGILIIPAITLAGLWLGVTYLFAHRPAVGVIAMETLDRVSDNPTWKYDLSSGQNSQCSQYQIGSVDQGQVVVLTQNDIEKSNCQNRTDIPSTLALVNLSDGKAIWKVDLATELDWTEKWHKQIIEIPGLNEILIKYTDVNGSDAGSNTKSIDKSDDRKMKTIVPYNRLNGLITDPVIAKSNSQPIMQAPVLQVLAIPGDVKNVLVMTNGAKKDFRYAKYRSKRFSSPKWSVESDLRPVGGTQIVDNKLVLGRIEGDSPTAINLHDGKFVSWNGNAATKIYYIGNQPVEILGDGVSDKATNLASQGGPKGHAITINAIGPDGTTIWTIKAKGYAIARDDSVTTVLNRNRFNRLFVFDGKDNRTISLVNIADGSIAWKTELSQTRFEVSRVTAGDRLAVYRYKGLDLETKTFSMLNLVDGSESKPMAIANRAVRVDGATTQYSILVDEPDRQQIIKDAEAGKTTSLDRKDNSSKVRKCLQGVDNPSSSIGWAYECNGNQHALRAGGRWLLLDLTPGSEAFWPLKGAN